MRLFLLFALVFTACTGPKPTDDTGDTDTDTDTDTDIDLQDADGDGYLASVDCDEADPDIHPGADEACDGVDNDCDTVVDDGVGSTWYTDSDADGYGDEDAAVTACDQPDGAVAEAGDCDDTSAAFHPGADETDCEDPSDYNCDGSVGYDDADADGWAACAECDDSEAQVNPSMSEVCNEIDDDCDGDKDEDVTITLYADLDGDGYGDPDSAAEACEVSDGWVTDATDCDDGNASAWPGAADVCDSADNDCDGNVDEDVLSTFYADGDGDGYGTDTTTEACSAPSGYAAMDGDCDDSDSAYNPGASESCDDPADYNCDGSVGYADDDGDGWAACEECDDADAGANPDATEVCDGDDDDCDGTVDEDDAADATTWYLDADADGYGGSRLSEVSCTAPAAYVDNADDCDDLDAHVSPAGTESCNGEDDDCDGTVDEDTSDLSTWYADIDGDGFGDATNTMEACDLPAGFVADATDCDDLSDTTNPDADEVCDEADNDCDGATDESATDAPTWYGDVDGDGYGATVFTLDACEQPAGYVAASEDCDDLDPDANPGETEVCDGDDDDCDGTSDEDDAADVTAYYLDTDSDGYGDPATRRTSCSVLSGYLTDGTDCDDTSANVSPAGTESCDAGDADEDCDGLADDADPSVTGQIEQFADADNDGYGTDASSIWACDLATGNTLDDTDCDDADASVNPSATEMCDAADTDEDCNGVADNDDSGATGTSTFYVDGDGDNYGDGATYTCDLTTGLALVDGDCDDDDATINPSGTETCDGIDNDCNGTYDDGTADATYYPDEDDDGFGDELATGVSACLAPVGYRLDNTDCDDTSITVHPYMWEDTTNGIDDDCDGLTDTADTTTVSTGPTGDDSSATVSLTATFPFCGTTRTTAYQISNGRITFGSADTDLSESTTDFYSDTAIAVAWDDLNPASGGTVKYIRYSDATGFYWNSVYEYGTTSTNTFAAILFDDGRVHLQYGSLSMTDGLVGYSCAPGSLTNSEVDIVTAMSSLGAGRWGLGSGTERMYYEYFSSSDNDLDNHVIRLCPYVDGSTDLCEE